jgi:hypothetical protein
MADCIVPGCRRNALNNLGVRLRKPHTSASLGTERQRLRLRCPCEIRCAADSRLRSQRLRPRGASSSGSRGACCAEDRDQPLEAVRPTWLRSWVCPEGCIGFREGSAVRWRCSCCPSPTVRYVPTSLELRWNLTKHRLTRGRCSQRRACCKQRRAFGHGNCRGNKEDATGGQGREAEARVCQTKDGKRQDKVVSAGRSAGEVSPPLR